MVQFVKWISYFVVVVLIFRLTCNLWVSNRRTAWLCYAARGPICNLCVYYKNVTLI